MEFQMGITALNYLMVFSASYEYLLINYLQKP
jgi:hypothetical protein